MERKVIQQNRTTFVVSLPKRWVEKNEVRKGDNLLINEEKNNTLTISKKDNIKKSCSISLKNLEEPKKRTVKLLFDDIYRKGYDEVKIECKDEDKEIIKDLINKQFYLGFEIFSESKSLIVITNFTDIKKEQFDQLMIKVIQITKELIKNLHNLGPENIMYVETSEKYCNFLRRLVVKENKSFKYSEILRTLSRINMVLFKIIHRQLKLNDPELNERIFDFYSKTYEKLFYNKVKLEMVQSKYIEVENYIRDGKLEEIHLYLWEIVRHISSGSTYIIALHQSQA